MPSYVIKCAPDRDEYVYWSDIVEAPHCIGTRAEVEDYMRQIGHGEDLPERFGRADGTGTSALPGFYAWDPHGSLIVQQRGILPRARLSEFCHLFMADDSDSAPCWALLEPFEDADLDGWLGRYNERTKGST